MSIVFIAVQCFQCSTMQVKQEKRSSNKWECVVCNEKQSVRKVYARAYQAKHVRWFVQAFNSTRSDGGGTWVADRSDGGGSREEEEEVEGGRRKRMDWTEYLDPKIDDVDEGGYYTDLVKCQKTATKKAPSKWNKYIEEEELKLGAGNAPLVPKESFRMDVLKKVTKDAPSKWSKYIEEEKEEVEDLKFGAVNEPLVAKNSSRIDLLKTDIKKAPLKWSKYIGEEEVELKFGAGNESRVAQKSLSTDLFKTGTKKTPSKWSKYIEEEEEEEEEMEMKFGGGNEILNAQESLSIEDLLLEEEVHPDFI